MPKRGKSNEEGTIFIWSDEEVKLLLHSALEYKTKKEVEIGESGRRGVWWDSVPSKYFDILEIFKKRYDECKTLATKVNLN